MGALATIEELEASDAERFRFIDGNDVGYFMDFQYWKPVPSDRVFYRRDDVTEGYVSLVAAGYGARGDYGSGSIFVRHSDLPVPLTPPRTP